MLKDFDSSSDSSQKEGSPYFENRTN